MSGRQVGPPARCYALRFAVMAAMNDEEPVHHPIHTAAEGGRIGEVRRLLDADPTLLERGDRYGGTPLHRAVLGRSRPVVTLLLDRGANIHSRYGADRPPFVSYPPQFSEPIDLALWGGARSVRTPQWLNALRCGASWARSLFRLRGVAPAPAPYDVPMARLLLNRGAAYDLTIAVALGDAGYVRHSLDNDPRRVRDARPNLRRPLTAAVEFGYDDIARLLIERGADPTWPDADDSPRGAALHNAARMGNRPMVELLLGCGADPNAFVNSSGNAMFVARTAEIRALLEAHGGTLDPYDLVWLDRDDDVLQRIAADPSSAYAGCGGVYPAVVTRQKRELLDRLLDARVTVPATPGGCRAYLLEQPDMLQKLLHRGGLDPDYTDENGATLLHALCSRDERGRTMDHRTECATLLLDAGATISARDRELKSTPLAWAARNDLPDMVEFLLARGAPVSLPDDGPDRTPLAWATRRGYAPIVAILRRHGAS